MTVRERERERWEELRLTTLQEKIMRGDLIETWK